MQKENISLDALTTTTTAAAPPRHFSQSNPFLSPTSPNNYLSSTDTSFYSSLFQNYSPHSISDAASFDGGDADCRLHDSSCILEYQQLYNRYTLCVAQLRDTIEEVDALRRENDSLRLSNADLTHRVALLFSRERLLSEFNRLNIASPSPAAAPPPVRVAAPQPLITEQSRFDRRNTERVALPKSISVRSKGYLKMTRPSRDTTRQKSQQRVYVPGAKKEEEALELDVYNQGMLKTELCNKWQETGTCPYGDNCQFAHGIKELRPVIRHPRYKTEVCRMVLAGDICPYGHRCHFRHALTEQERLMVTPAPAPPRSSIRIHE
ncbi:zinc finger CCCH domain-containing protein 14 [Phtheirospermum japonicum]|uniref:Zinc finger CCCH domain-containing protein 14 n=1 Tax=Phtheirospermum japonicum TaxID=374723 RepID=A0A830C8C6_9LAMI|nr:zinc finger CCCH domain-containing protein 14 [Phtheirospermum japonicum]